MNNPEIVLIAIGVTIGTFLLMREVFCWYFKINKRAKVMENILSELVKLNEPKP